MIDAKNINDYNEHIYTKWSSKHNTHFCNEKITNLSCDSDYYCCGVKSSYDKLNFINNQQFNEFNKKHNLEPNIRIFGDEETGVPPKPTSRENEGMILNQYDFYKSINKYFKKVIIPNTKSDYKCIQNNKNEKMIIS